MDQFCKSNFGKKDKITKMDKKKSTLRKGKKIGKNTQKKKKKAQTDGSHSKVPKKKTDLVVVLRKITTNRLIIHKTLNNAIRSSFVQKDTAPNLNEESKALIDEDLIKLIDINNKNIDNKQMKDNDENILAKQMETINEISENKSIFREIDMKYEEITKNASQETDNRIYPTASIFREIDMKYEEITKNASQETDNRIYPTASIFREIDMKYEEITKNARPETNNRIYPTDLEGLVRKKYLEHQNMPVNKWQNALKSFLNYSGAPSYSAEVLSRIVATQSEINQNGILWELNDKYQNRRTAESFLKRQFVKKCNELTKLQNLGGNLIHISQVGDLIRNAGLLDSNEMSLTPLKHSLNLEDFLNLKDSNPENNKYDQTGVLAKKNSLDLEDFRSLKYMSPKNIKFDIPRNPFVKTSENNEDFCCIKSSTPKKTKFNIIDVTTFEKPLYSENFIGFKSKTPENQKFLASDNPSTSVQLTPAIKSNFGDKYLRLSSKRCLNNDFVKQYGINKQQQSFFLKQAIEDENNRATSLESILNRPKKPPIFRKDRSNISFDYTSPKSVPLEENFPKLRPNRKLNFSEKFADDNFDFLPLTDPVPNLQARKYSPSTFRTTKKRILGEIYTPPEIAAFKRSLPTREDILNDVKRFSMRMNYLEPIPEPRNTPQFKFQPFPK